MLACANYEGWGVSMGTVSCLVFELFKNMEQWPVIAGSLFSGALVVVIGPLLFSRYRVYGLIVLLIISSAILVAAFHPAYCT
jgi:hypothetical protein